jgi:hypothetical protein
LRRNHFLSNQQPLALPNEQLTFDSNLIKALFRYLTCMILVPARTATKIHPIGFLNTDTKMVLSKLDNAFVERTVYPPKSAQTPISIPIRRSPYCDSDRIMRPIRDKRVRMV